MKKKRERFEIIHDILLTVTTKQQVGPTRLLQLSNLSPQMFKEYVEELLSQSLIEEKIIKRRKVYILTDKGYRFLEQYRHFLRFVEDLGL